MGQDLNLNTDLIILNGDFQISNNDVKHVEDILLSSPGWWKRSPFIGAEVIRYLGGPQNQRLVRNIKLQVEQDGYSVEFVRVVNNQIYITGVRNGEAIIGNITVN